MVQAFICDYVRTPIGRYGGALAKLRADDLAAIPIMAIKARNPGVDWEALDEVYFGCANQAGEDNRNVARMALLLAGLPVSVPGMTVNRLCGSGMDAILTAARGIMANEIDLAIAGGVESMSRAPFVMAKAETAFSRSTGFYDTTMGWRFINSRMQQLYGTDSMPETAENVAEDYVVSREDQDRYALHSQTKAKRAQDSGRLSREIVSVTIPQQRKDAIVVNADEHLRPETTLEKLASLPTPFRSGGSVTAGNASGINDGAAALIIASEAAAEKHGLTPLVRISSGATAGVAPRIMGYGPVPAIAQLITRIDLDLEKLDVLEINEAFASQALATLRAINLADNDPRVNPNGGAIALGHPLGMSGARITGTAALELNERGGRHAIAAMCIGVGQGIAVALERV